VRRIGIVIGETATAVIDRQNGPAIKGEARRKMVEIDGAAGKARQAHDRQMSRPEFAI
jgi:hypothetical protein